MHLVGFIIRIYHDARSPEPQIFRELYSSFAKLVSQIFTITFVSFPHMLLL
jgi:hypothetical protein